MNETIRIFSDLPRKYAPLLRKAYVEGSQTDESIYIDFENSKLYFFLRNKFDGRIKIELEKPDDLSISGIWVNNPTFLALMNEYPYIDFDSENKTFLYGDTEEFKLTYSEEGVDKSKLDFFESKNLDGFDTFSIKDSDRDIIMNSFYFMGSGVAQDKHLEGITITGDKVVSYNGISMYEASLSFKTEFPVTFISEFQSVLAFLYDIEVYSSESRGSEVYITSYDEEIIIALQIASNLFCPDIHDESFRKNFEYDEYVCVNKEEIHDIISFFNDFRRGDKANTYIQIGLDTKNDLTFLSLVSLGKKSKAKRTIEVTEFNEELLNFSFLVHRESLFKAISLMKGDNINLRYQEGCSSINIEDGDNENIHVVTTRFTT